VYQSHVLSVSSFFYVVSVAFECFKTRSGCCTWDARGKRESTSGLRARSGGTGMLLGRLLARCAGTVRH
jgi:hypothetical protein